MRARGQWLLWIGVVGASLGVHAVAFGGLHGGHDDGFAQTPHKPTSTLVEDERHAQTYKAPDAAAPEPAG